MSENKASTNGNRGDDKGEESRSIPPKGWSNIPLFKQHYEDSETFRMNRVNDTREKAKALLHWRKERVLPEGYSFWGIQIVDMPISDVLANKVPDNGHKFVHVMSVDCFYIDDSGGVSKTSEIHERASYARSILTGKPMHARLQPWYFPVNWDGIEDAASAPGTMASKFANRSRL